MLADIFLTCLVLAVLVPVAVVAIECLLAVLLATNQRDLHHVAAKRPLLAVLIPAHNEEAGIAQTLAAIVHQLRQGDRLVVVADNCADRTADIARDAGAEVIERVDDERRGKGYALDAGIRYLAASGSGQIAGQSKCVGVPTPRAGSPCHEILPVGDDSQNDGDTPADRPEVLVVVDADCDCQSGSLAELAAGVAQTGRTCQAAYLMETPPEPSPATRVSAFAFRVKNLVRPLGLHRLGLPCLLTGTGMAFPWASISGAALASGNIVEDMQLGLDLAIAGHPPRFCPGATVVGRLPAQACTADTQRTRWEHGHLQTMLTQVPRLIGRGVTTFSPRLLGLALELAVPPLSLLVFAWIVLSAAAVAGAFVAGWRLPLILAIAGWILLSAAIGSAWWRFARDILPLRQMLFIPVYMLGKIPRFVAFVTRRQREWIRTAREVEKVDS
ncbi:MAG: glycosyltransferase family 2 protein [Tepidisphaeraceae bacterium]